MVINFRVRGISRGGCKLTQTPTLKKEEDVDWLNIKYFLFMHENIERKLSIMHENKIFFVFLKGKINFNFF
jgi:hypothetical protein